MQSRIKSLASSVETADKAKLVEVLIDATRPGLITLDYSDIDRVIKKGDIVQLGIGSGKDLARAVKVAFSQVDVDDVRDMLVIIDANEETELSEVENALGLLDGITDNDGNTLFCMTLSQRTDVGVSIVLSSQKSWEE